jgi:hypothetical protein
MVGAVMATQDALRTVQAWFGQVKLASLELPKRWFGRPNDNLHQLTWSAATAHKVLLEFDHQILLIITDPDSLDVTEYEVRVHDCAQVSLDWQEYGNLKSHLDDHGSGTVRLLAQGAAPQR